MIGIGLPRANLGSNPALRGLAGKSNFYSSINEGESDRPRLTLQVIQEGSLPAPSIHDIGDHDAVFAPDGDLT